MMTLPPGFDISSLGNDFGEALAPFVTVALIILAYKIVKYCIDGGAK